jgi:hypothetical protein
VCTAAITAAGPVAAAVTAQPVEPLLALEQEWSGRLHYANIEQPGDTDEERQPAFDALYAVELEIRKTPAQSFAGLAVKLRLFAHRENLFKRPDWWGLDGQDQLLLAALRDAERLAGDAS